MEVRWERGKTSGGMRGVLTTRGLPVLLIAFGLTLTGALPLPGQAGAAGPTPVVERPDLRPDLRRAERGLERARSELEEIVGPRLLGTDPPPLPEVPPGDLSPDETSFVDRLAGTPPGEWTAEERERLAELLAGEAPRLAAAASRGETVSTDQLASRAMDLLPASRLLALRDRLALAEGRERELADGLAARLDLAKRLRLQPGVFGSLVAGPIHLRALQDVQLLVTEGTTSGETLERLEALLFDWRLRVPDPEVVVAREGLLVTDPEQISETSRELLPDEAGFAVFAAPLARDLAELARRCREEGCRAAVDAIENGFLEDDDPYRVIARMMIPNLLDSVRKFTGSRELTRIALVAAALRLEALELERYPEDLERIASRLGMSPEEADTLDYERHPDGGASLRFTSDRIVTESIERHRDQVRPLVEWYLPPG